MVRLDVEDLLALLRQHRIEILGLWWIIPTFILTAFDTPLWIPELVWTVVVLQKVFGSLILKLHADLLVVSLQRLSCYLDLRIENLRVFGFDLAPWSVHQFFYLVWVVGLWAARVFVVVREQLLRVEGCFLGTTVFFLAEWDELVQAKLLWLDENNPLLTVTIATLNRGNLLLMFVSQAYPFFNYRSLSLVLLW